MLRFLAIALFPALASAVCSKVEYAELDTMTGEQILTMRCQYRADWMTMSKGFNPQSIHGSNLQWAHTKRCLDQIERMDRVIERKVSLTPPEITKRCK